MAWRTMKDVDPEIDLLSRMEEAVDKVRDRLKRVTNALDEAGVHYAVAGGNAVAAWVATVDLSAVRNTRDVDIVVDRNDLDAVKAVLENHGFIYRRAAGVEMFLDGPGAGARDAVQVVFGGEKVRENYPMPAPTAGDSETSPEGFRVLSLPALVSMMLTSFRRKDQVHVQDLIDVGLVSEAELKSLPSPLNERLRELLEDTDR